jgi:uncharacterized iron-regulated protein
VIEYLLWGRDTEIGGPGNRPHTDYVSSESPLAVRRGRYLRLSVEHLIRELDALAREWKKERPDNYRAKFLAMPPLGALGLAVKGMGALSGPELAGERLAVAYETKGVTLSRMQRRRRDERSASHEERFLCAERGDQAAHVTHIARVEHVAAARHDRNVSITDIFRSRAPT